MATYEKGMFYHFILIGLLYKKRIGFLLILEPFETDNATVPNPVFHLTWVWILIKTTSSNACPRCLDPSIAIKPVFERFSSVVITSGTISPLDMYPKMLQFTPVVQETYPMTLTRNSFLPLVCYIISSLHRVRNLLNRSSPAAVIKLPSARGSRLGMIQRSFGISEASLWNIVRLSPMA